MVYLSKCLITRRWNVKIMSQGMVARTKDFRRSVFSSGHGRCFGSLFLWCRATVTQIGNSAQQIEAKGRAE
jgi:predicted metal-binding transcription factor (methanogenesis marker protein 9)